MPIFIITLLVVLNAGFAAYNYSTGSFGIGLFNAFVAGFCLAVVSSLVTMRK